MPTNTYYCVTEWAGAANGPTVNTRSFSRDVTIQFPNGIKFNASSAPEYLGDGDRVNPEQLFTASVSTCQMLTYLYEAGRAHIKILGYVDNAEGELGLKDGKMRITKVTLKPRIMISADSDPDKALELVYKAHDNCFVSNSISSEWVVKPEIVIDEVC